MARDHAQIRLDMWGDDDWRQLSVPAQHLYMLLLTSPTLNFCGVVDWRPARIARLARGWTTSGVEKAATELTDQLFLVIDADTEEALIRSFVRYDGVMKQPNMATAMATDHAAIASATLRGVVVHELRRLRDKHPDWAGWRSTKALAVLDRNAIDPRSNPSVNPSVKGSVDPSVDPYPNPSGDPSVDPCPTPAPAPTPLKNPPDRPKPEPRPDVEALCEHLRRRLVDNGRQNITITEDWRTNARLILDRDNRPPAEAHALIDWCQDDTFWRPNIGGMSKFRKQYDTLRLQADKNGLRVVTDTSGARTFTAAELDTILGPAPAIPQPPSHLTADEMWEWAQKARRDQRADRVRRATEKLGRTS